MCLYTACISVYIHAYVCVCRTEKWWLAHPPSLDDSRDFLHNLLKWQWTFTFQSWFLHDGQWPLLVSPLGVLSSFHHMADSLFSFLSVHLQIAGLTARNCLKTDLGLPELAQRTNALAEFTTKVYFFAILWGQQVSWLLRTGYSS